MCMKCIIDNAGLFESQRIHNLRFSATMWQKNDVSCHMILNSQQSTHTDKQHIEKKTPRTKQAINEKRTLELWQRY